MILLLQVDDLDLREPVICHYCGSAMRLVGIEPHPKPSSAMQLVTYECRCGKSMAQAELSDEWIPSARTRH
jgi:hypothetical protein